MVVGRGQNRRLTKFSLNETPPASPLVVVVVVVVGWGMWTNGAPVRNRPLLEALLIHALPLTETSLSHKVQGPFPNLQEWLWLRNSIKTMRKSDH